MACLGSTAVRAEGPVYFADANLKNSVELALGKTNPAPTDMLGLDLLNASERGITRLTGLEYVGQITTAERMPPVEERCCEGKVGGV
jgi:hypothetical protein